MLVRDIAARIAGTSELASLVAPGPLPEHIQELRRHFEDATAPRWNAGCRHGCGNIKTAAPLRTKMGCHTRWCAARCATRSNATCANIGACGAQGAGLLG